jgi:intein/homing endonuclease
MNLTKNVETRIKLNSFNFREYQKPLVRAIERQGYKRAFVAWPRRGGKDLTSLQIALRQALLKTCTIFYIFPSYSNARKAIWDAITIDGQKIIDFFPDFLCKKNNTEMKITFINNSVIQFMGSTEFDRLRGTNPYMVIFSEYAYQNPQAYAVVRPILAANNGVAIFISCVAPNTIVITQDGMTRIKDITASRKEYTNYNKDVYGLGGFHNATHTYYSKKIPTLKIRLSTGFEIECSKVHKLWNGNKWIKSTDVKINDKFPVQYGQSIFGTGINISDFEFNGRYVNGFPLSMSDNRLFYLLGLIHGDGNFDKNKVTITNKNDKFIQNFITSIGFKTYGTDKIHYSYNSQLFCAFLEYLGFKNGAKNKEFPIKLLKCNKEQLKQFIQGLFDSDGSANKKRGNIHIASACKSFIKDLQIILLNFGIVSYFQETMIKPNNKIKVDSMIYKLELNGYFSEIFYREIGFKIPRKQYKHRYVSHRVKEESGNIYDIDISKLSFKPPKNIITNPEKMSRRMVAKLAKKYNDKYLESLLEEKFFYSNVVSIEESESEVFDFVIPETHSFFSNGFISHNTVFGKNHFYDMYQLAKNSPDWFCDFKTVDDTMHISDEALMQEKAQMSYDMFMQEYYNSFDVGVRGAYYSRYINNLRLNNQISDVPYEPRFPVHTAWDIGFSDSTAIIFFQTIGTTIHVIDYYENNKHGLEHYIKYLDTKPYKYGKHIAPHDMGNSSFSTGMTRLETASDLGIDFILAPKLSILDGIEAVRQTLPKCYFDEHKTEKLIGYLNIYHQEWDDRRQDYKNQPFHGPESHAADAFRMLSVSLNRLKPGMSQEDIDRMYHNAIYGNNNNLPDVFTH